jgi:hypothetical protein
MATRAETYRARVERSPKPNGKRKRRVSMKKPKKGAWSHEKHHAEVKATHAYEPSAPGKRPSRESTRASANRSKPDAAFDVTQEVRKGAPEVRARKERARATRVRGG